VSRMYPSDFHDTFDLPPATISAEKRYITNVPQQRLFFLNNTFVQKQADAIADRIKSEATPEAQVKKAFELVYQRRPTLREIAASVAFIQKPPHLPVPETPSAEAEAEKSDKEEKDAPKQLPDSPLRSFCWALLSSNEFLYID
jgi:hypothetical protein